MPSLLEETAHHHMPVSNVHVYTRPLTHTYSYLHAPPHRTMWSLFRLALLLLCAVAAVAWQDYPAGRAPGVTHESFCLPSAAVTKKPLARSRPYYDSTLPSSFVITFWAQPTQVLVITLKAWVRRGWEHVLDYQNLLREDECPITRQYDWRLADYTAVGPGMTSKSSRRPCGKGGSKPCPASRGPGKSVITS